MSIKNLLFQAGKLVMWPRAWRKRRQGQGKSHPSGVTVILLKQCSHSFIKLVIQQFCLWLCITYHTNYQTGIFFLLRRYVQCLDKSQTIYQYTYQVCQYIFKWKNRINHTVIGNTTNNVNCVMSITFTLATAAFFLILPKAFGT